MSVHFSKRLAFDLDTKSKAKSVKVVKAPKKKAKDRI